MILECVDASFSYEGKIVAEKIDFSVNKGDFLTIVGENGSGKSTLVKGILGLIKPRSGKIIFGSDIKKNEIGYLPQQSDLQKNFPASVLEIVISGCLNKKFVSPFYSKENKKTAEYNMERLNILNLKNKCFHDLSGGQKQKVLLARALCSAGSVILLDEPVTGLDPVSTYEMYALIKELNERDEMTVIMVSHDIKNAVLYSSHILHLHSKPLFFGSASNYSFNKIQNERTDLL